MMRAATLTVNPHLTRAHFGAQLGSRFRNSWVFKMVGTALGMTVFFMVYFALARDPVFPVTTMPLLAVDRWIAFQPAALPLYLSLWLYVSLVPALLADRREFVFYGVAVAVLSAVGLGIFFLWPTSVPLFDGDASRDATVRYLHVVDAAGNACPSLHAAFTVFTALWLRRLLRQMGAGSWIHIVVWVWCVGILYSTVAVRQHVVLDVVAGTALGLAVGLMQPRSLRVFPGSRPQ